MASIILGPDRRVLPNWRSFNDTTAIGELGHYNIRRINDNAFSIDEYVNDWDKYRDVLFAGELLSAAVSNSQIGRDEVTDAADFIIKNKDKASIAQIELANSIIESVDQHSGVQQSLDVLDVLLKRSDIYPKITLLKNRINSYPFNPILYVEIARYYILLGLEKKAEKAMKIAVQLAPHNRYVTRCAARLLLHIGDKEGAHEIVAKNGLLKEDPWLLASEISINMLRGRYSRYIKISKSILQSGNYDPFTLSELASTMGTLEFEGGSNKKSRCYFEQSLRQPNDNSLAQAEWAVSQKVNLHIGSQALLVKNNYEAQSMYLFFQEDFPKALEQAKLWLCDTPFSKRAVLHGSELAYIHLKKFDVAQQILNIGVQAHPRDAGLLNNLAYSYALDGKLDEAEQQLKIIEKLNKADIKPEEDVCWTATKGLLAYKRKDIERGRQLYRDAIHRANDLEIDDIEFQWNAMLNFMREEILAAPDAKVPDEYINYIEDIKELPHQKYITQLKADVNALIKKRTIDLAKKQQA